MQRVYGQYSGKPQNLQFIYTYIEFDKKKKDSIERVRNKKNVQVDEEKPQKTLKVAKL